MKHALKLTACMLAAIVFALSFAGCTAEKNTVSEGLEKFDSISENYKIPEKDIKISESADKKVINYTYSFDVFAGNSKITLLASADKDSKELIESSVWFVGSGKTPAGEISQDTVDEFAELAKSSVLSFTELTENDADKIIKELKAGLAESYDGKTSLTKDIGNYRFGFSSSAILTAFTIKNIQADVNSSQEDITVKPD